ncbi:hypothetical protein [Paraburkholderia elongata]|uniref:Uncharacterized protein n=1 Tax=Paraburkholderia elongata TaxID=2675747 RepID=A0A972ST47_9BURK|nr:hypothetical protein [Paraburkholderia elongata]NPT62565.1 hypothetical protein [Paraburkholderia elongata]
MSDLGGHTKQDTKERSSQRDSDKNVHQTTRGDRVTNSAVESVARGHSPDNQYSDNTGQGEAWPRATATDYQVEKAARCTKDDSVDLVRGPHESREEARAKLEREVTERLRTEGVAPTEANRALAKMFLIAERHPFTDNLPTDPFFPPLDRNFDGLKSFADKDAAIRNQDNLRELIGRFGDQYKRLTHAKERVTLELGEDATLTLGSVGKDLFGDLGDRTLEQLTDAGIEKLVGKMTDKPGVLFPEELMDAPGGAALSLFNLLQIINTIYREGEIKELLRSDSPDARKWRDDTVISLLAENMASQNVRQTWVDERRVLDPVQEHDRLVNDYRALENALSAHIRYLDMAGDIVRQANTTIGMPRQ